MLGCLSTRTTRSIRGVFPFIIKRQVARFSSSSNFHQDPALEWGRANQEVAQECLNLPSDEDLEQLRYPLKNWSDYWKWRKWDFSSVSSPEDLCHAQALTTHVLSAPLSIVNLVLAEASLKETSLLFDSGEERILRICCVGARAESMLPVEYWKELLLVLNYSGVASIHTGKCNILLSFLGPEIIRRPPARFTIGDRATLELEWRYKGLFHEYAENENNSTDYDAFIFLNPGLGHPHLVEGWKPTLDVLMKNRALNDLDSRNRLLFMTAHSHLDAIRDADFLEECFSGCFKPRSPVAGEESVLSYQENPFASRIFYQDEDPAEPEHFVQPNHHCRTLLIPRI